MHAVCTRPSAPACLRPAALLLASLLAGLPAAQAADEDPAWAVAGQQGLVRMVIVPGAQARDAQAYQRQIQRLCEPGRTCFLNFYTNSSGATLDLPLPEAIANEATAVFRRSEKQRAERFQWSCRLQVSQAPCF